MVGVRLPGGYGWCIGVREVVGLGRAGAARYDKSEICVQFHTVMFFRFFANDFFVRFFYGGWNKIDGVTTSYEGWRCDTNKTNTDSPLIVEISDFVL